MAAFANHLVGWIRNVLLTALVAVLSLSLLLGGLFWWFSRSMTRSLVNPRRQLLSAMASRQSIQSVAEWGKSRLSKSFVGNRDSAQIPAAAKVGNVHSIEIFQDVNGRAVSVLLWCGGADNHYGLVIGLDDPPQCWFPLRRHLGSGVWLYDELKGMPTSIE